MLASTDVSVVIPSYKSIKTLAQCLASVIQQKTQYSYEVIVVHSGSEAIDPEIMSSFSSVRFQIASERWLPGKARNWALHTVQSPWILFLDSDCVVDQSWIQTMILTALKYSADGAGGSVTNARTRNIYSWVMHLLEFGEWLPGTRPKFCANFPSCNALYKRSVLLALGGFPEDVFPCEDTVLNYLLRCKDARLVFVPNSIANHMRERDWSTLIQYSYDFGFSYGHACRKYQLPGYFIARLSPPVLIPIVVVGRLIRIFCRLLPHHIPELLVFTLGFPLLIAGLLSWSWGYVHGLRCTTSTAIRVDNKLLDSSRFRT